MSKNDLIKIFTVLFLVLSFCLIEAAPAAAQAQREDPALKAAREADEAYNNRDYQTAIDKYNLAIRLAPVNPYCFFWRGGAQMNLGKYSEALDSYNRALQQNYRPAKEVYLERWRARYFLNDKTGAEADLREVTKLDPKDINSRLILTDILRLQKKYAQAIQVADEAARVEPENGDVNYYTALVYSDQKMYLQSSQQAIESIKKKSQYSAESRTIIAGNLVLVKRYDDAVQQYQAAIQEKPNLVFAYWGLSTVYEALNKPTLAIQTLEKAIKIDPENGTTYSNLSFTASMAGVSQKALEAGKLAVRYAPNDYMSYTNLCRAHIDLKQFDTAIEVCNQALDLKPGDGETLFYLGLAQKNKNAKPLAKRLFEQAVKGLEQFVRENPEYKDGYFLLGNAYVETEQWGKAITAYTKAVEISEKFARAHFNLGNAYLKINDVRSAREQHAKLKLLDPVRAATLLKNITAVSGNKANE